MAVQRECFVVMPIGKPGDPDHTHFSTLFTSFICPPLASLNFRVTRADQIFITGKITDQILKPLASADLVVVDLTDYNPNVFYELGVRHTLRKSGTILLIDINRKGGGELPFDIKDYRVIQYSSSGVQIGELPARLRQFAEQLNDPSPEFETDSPVHATFRDLPGNVVHVNDGSEVTRLNRDLTSVRQVLKRYTDAYGPLNEGIEEASQSPLASVREALHASKDGHLLSKLIEQAEQCSLLGRSEEFLTVLTQVMESSIFRPNAQEVLRLLRAAEQLDLREVTNAIFSYGIGIHPKDRRLRHAYFGRLAHSTDSQTKSKAVEEIAKDLEIDISDPNNVRIQNLDRLQNDERLSLLGFMLDALNQEESPLELNLTAKLVEVMSNRTEVLRSHARALESQPNAWEEAVVWYKAALACPDVDDTSPRWFGNDLHNRGHNVDAAEAYMCACLADPDDAAGFAHAADELSTAMLKKLGGLHRSYRSIPDSVVSNDLYLLLLAVLSCRVKKNEDVERSLQAAQRASVDQEAITEAIQQAANNLRKGQETTTGYFEPLMPVTERLELARRLYKILLSDLTRGSVFAQSLSPVEDFPVPSP